jgi:hypothetical protein
MCLLINETFFGFCVVSICYFVGDNDSGCFLGCQSFVRDCWCSLSYYDAAAAAMNVGLGEMEVKF